MEDVSQLVNELTFKAVRSSGSGGQHVNKVATKVVLYFNIEASKYFTEKDKVRLLDYFGNRLTKTGILVLSSEETRSQLKNKNIVIGRFLSLVKEALKEEKKRLETKIPKAVKQKRLDNKKKTSEKKANRKPPRIE